MLRLFGLTKVPLLFWIRSRVVVMNDRTCNISIPLNRRTKNHLNSIYFGVLGWGADAAGGLMAMKLIANSGQKVSLAFKEFHARFLKRAEGKTYFTYHQGEEIRAFVDMLWASDKRHHMPVTIIANCPKQLGDEPVGEFTLVLSLKKK